MFPATPQAGVASTWANRPDRRGHVGGAASESSPGPGGFGVTGAWLRKMPEDQEGQ